MSDDVKKARAELGDAFLAVQGCTIGSDAALAAAVRFAKSANAYAVAIRSEMGELVEEDIGCAMRYIPSKMTGETATDYRARTNDDQEFNAGLDAAITLLRARLNGRTE